MLILAQAQNDNLIVQMTQEELANLLGFYGTYDDGFRKINDKLIGKELKISDLYKGYSTIRDLAAKKKSIAQSLSDLIDSVKSIHEIKLLEPKLIDKK